MMFEAIDDAPLLLPHLRSRAPRSLYGFSSDQIQRHEYTKTITTSPASFNRLASNATDDVESGALDLDPVLRFARRSGRHRHSNFEHPVLVGRLNL